MYSTHLFFCFVVIGGGLTSPQNGDLQLDRVFRTPKDFSKVNFDHFEILERNNFENTLLPPATAESKPDVGQSTLDQPPKSVANAQVMLRFGGDDIHNCRGLPVPSLASRLKDESPCEPSCTEPCSEPCRPVCPNSVNVVAAPTVYPYSDYGYSAYPNPAYPYVPTNPIASQYGYTYPPTPYSFPGYYYGAQPYPGYLSNPYAYYNRQFVPPCEEVEICEKTTPCEKIDSCEKVDSCETIITPCEDSCEAKESFLDCRKPSRPPPCGSRPKILCAKVLSDEKIQNIDIPDIQNGPKFYVKDKIYMTNQGPAIVEEIVDASCEEPEVVKIEKIDGCCVDPNPCLHKVSYAEENIRESVREHCKIPKHNIETLLDQALVPLTCQKCQSRQRLLVTYPISGCGRKVVTIPEDEIEITCPKCACCEKQRVCGCCNRVRNCSIPYGKRFLADVDSLLEVVPSRPSCGCRYVNPVLYKSPCDVPARVYPTIRDPCCNPAPIDICDEPCAPREITVLPPCQESIIPSRTPRVLNQVVSVPHASTPSVINQVVNVPGGLYGGYGRLPEPYYTSTLPRLDRSDLLVDDIITPGAECYTDAVKSVLYKEPAISNVITLKHPGLSVVEETNCAEPHLYKVIPKYDVCPREEIRTLDIPDLVPTNRYLCAKCNNLIPPRTVCNREYLPVDRRVPVIRDLPCLPSLARDVPVIREGPVVTVSRRYCPTCAKYTGELNE